MKEFDKWYKTYKHGNDFALSYCQHAWKAALRWALDRQTLVSDEDLGFPVPVIDINVIEQELEGLHNSNMRDSDKDYIEYKKSVEHDLGQI